MQDRSSRLVAALVVVVLAVALLPMAAAEAYAADLFFSEYIEGSSFNKAVEIYNATGAAVDLAAGGYNVYMSFNGGTSTFTINLTGTVASGDVFVVAPTNANATILAQADQQAGTAWFNGDDAVALRKGTANIDVIGQIGFDPGSRWGTSPTSTENNTLRRKASVCAGDTNGADVFTPATEWVGYAQDTFDGLGNHTATCIPRNPVINEFVADHAGTDTSEYVEVFGDPLAGYSPFTLVQIDGDGADAGVIDAVWPVGTTDAGGFWFTGYSAGIIEDGTLTLLLVGNFSGALGTDLDTNNDGTFDATPWSAIADAVAVNDGSDTSDRTYGLPSLGVAYDGLSLAPGGASRLPDGLDTDAAGDWMRNDFDLAGIPGYVGTPVYHEAYNTPGATNQAVPPCGEPSTPIYQVQGNGLASPLVGTEVAVEGVVVGDFQAGGKNGYYLQDPAGDADPATSDGVFIYSGTPVAVGDRVRVRGNVSEYYTLTEITPGTVWVCSSGNPLPAATPLALPVPSQAFFEPFEGMLVTFPQTLYISEVFDFDRYGEIVLTGARQYTPTAVVEPGAPAIALAAANALDRITLDDGRTTQNPDPARHPNGADFTLANRFRGGDTVTGVTGILDYAYDKYRIQPTQGAAYAAANPRPGVPAVGGTLKVASLNVLNYFTTLGSRGAGDAAEFTRQRDKVIAALVAIDADVAGLTEIENNTAAIADLVAGLNAAMGAGTYAYIDAGVIGGDQIKVALIYKPATVTPRGAYAILTSAVDPRFIDTKNRPALAQTFRAVAGGGIFTVAVNHLKSKGSACSDVGDPDLGDGAGNCNLTRRNAALALVDWLASDPTGSGDEDFLIIGDLNSYDKEDPIDALRAGGYTDLIGHFQGEYAYSYLFDGQLGYLDYALASSGLMGEVTGAADWHNNADEPDLLDYDMTFKAPAQDALYEPNAYRASDHDAVLVGLALVDTVAPVVGAMPNLLLEGTGPGGAVATWVDPTATDVVPPAPVVSCVPGSGSMFPFGATRVTCSASDSAGNTGSSSFTVTVVDTTPPALTVPGDMTVEATGPSGAAVSLSVSAVDVVSGSRPVVCVPASGSLFPFGTTPVTCSATDLAGNSRVKAFTVRVVDTTPPALTLPGDMTVEATGPFGAAVSFSVFAADAVSGPVPLSCLPASGTMFGLGARNVLCRAVDGAGNWGGGSFTVTVLDTAPPVITLLGEASVRVAVGSVYAEAGATAADLVDGDLTGVMVTVNPVNTGAPGDFVVTYDVVDSHGNHAVQVSREVRVAYFCAGQEATMWGTEGGDTLIGTAGRDVIVGLGGDDFIRGLGGDDLVCAGAGDDTVQGGDGDDVVRAGAGDDRLIGGAGDDLLGGGAGRDVADYGSAGGAIIAELLFGRAIGEGFDRLRLVEDVVGSRFADLLIGGPRRSVLWGGAGNDVLRGGGADDTLWGGIGDDHLYGNGGDDTLWGGPGTDRLFGGLGHDILDGIPE